MEIVMMMTTLTMRMSVMEIVMLVMVLFCQRTTKIVFIYCLQNVGFETLVYYMDEEMDGG